MTATDAAWVTSSIAAAGVAVKTGQQVYADYQRFKSEPDVKRIWVLIRKLWAERARIFRDQQILQPARAWYIDRFVSVRNLKCRACGLRARSARFPQEQDRIALAWLPESRLLRATCPRCSAAWPESPVFDADGWAPVMKKAGTDTEKDNPL